MQLKSQHRHMVGKKIHKPQQKHFSDNTYEEQNDVFDFFFVEYGLFSSMCERIEASACSILLVRHGLETSSSR